MKSSNAKIILMKNFREKIDKWLENLDRRWDAMPIKKQHTYLRYFFTGYLLLTIVVVVNVWRDTAACENRLEIGHIQTAARKKKSPTELQNTLKSILKNKNYEGK